LAASAAEAQFTYTTNNGALTITGYSGPGGAVTIPSAIGGLPVAGIGTSAFEDNHSLVSIAIPDSVTAIGDAAFDYCYNLTSITIPEGVTSIGNYAFGYCSSLLAFTIPNGVTSIGTGAFDGCTDLTSVTIPDGVASIGAYAFAWCGQLASLTIPESVTNIGQLAFAGCASLGSVAIPNGVTSIGEGAFVGCTLLRSVTIPGGVMSIGDQAFSWCIGLTSVTISEGVASIGEWAFADCTNLPAATIPSSVTSIGGMAFYADARLSAVTIGPGVTTIGAEAFANCARLLGVYFQGDAPSAGPNVFSTDVDAVVYYLPGTAGWGASFCGLPAAMLSPPPGPTITAQPQSLTLGFGSSAVFSVAAIGSAPLAYQWFFDDSIIPGATGTNYTIADVQDSDAGYYKVVVSDSVGATTSYWAALNLLLAPTITTQPQSQAVILGTNAVFSTAASGDAPLGYQWFFDNGLILGANGTNYTIPSVQSSNAGNYTVVVTNIAGSATSQLAVLSVLSPTTPTFLPTLTSEPQSQTVAPGASVSFMVAATGTAPLSYQWRFNGVNLTDGGQVRGTTTDVLWLSSVSTWNAGAYDVVVSNYGGAVTSAVANLTFPAPAQNPVSFAAGTNTGAQFSEVLVPVQVDGFTNLLSFQFSLHWDAAVATFVDVEQFGLGGLAAASFGTGLTNTGTLTVSWDDRTGFGQDLGDGTAVFALRFVLIGSPGSASPITLDGTPTRVEAANSDLVLVPAQTLAGQVSVVGAGTVGISGIVFYYPTNYPATQPSGENVAGVPVNLNGGWDTNVLSAADGSYSFAGIAAGRNYGVTLAKPDDDLPENGVTTLDVALIRRHVLGLGALDSPYKLLAADVSASGMVTTLDIALIRRLILGLTNTFPAGLWRFVPADYVFADPANPWGAPTSRGYTNLMTSMAGQDHVAIKLGDVNNSWSKAEIGKAESRNLAPELPAVRFEAGSRVAQPGERVAVPLSVSGFHQATSAQFTLGWDARVLRYAGVGEFGLRGLEEESFGTVLAGSGKLAFSWDDAAGTGLEVADGSQVFTVYFDVIGAAGSVSPVSFADSPTVGEATVNFGVRPFAGGDGRVMVAGERPVISWGGGPGKGKFRLSVPSVKDRRYILEYSDSLSGANWQVLGAMVGDGSVKILSDPTATPQPRFYRVRVE